MSQLHLDDLPDLPQAPALRLAARKLWENPQVLAIWLGGSFASGGADVYSDVDLRIAVPPGELDRWRRPDWRAIFGLDLAGASFMRFGDDALLHHAVLEDGSIFDFYVQTTGRDNPEHAITVLGCRDDAFAERLASFERPSPAVNAVPEPNDIRQLIVDNWILSHKHRKPLARGLHLMATVCIHAERMGLMRLLYVRHSGRDMARRPTIHSLTPVTLSLQQALGPRALELIGMPLRSEEEIIAAIEALRDLLAAVGRALAERMGFDYPHQLEQTVRAAWRQFRDGRGKCRP